ncbi:hypothetical protein F4779DRAFT_571033 [Xylariaceae sp. FL0662B]|nr:hypothetical protein F4779DRAFT_571033 [Xylariaceae sp. FL0662B]
MDDGKPLVFQFSMGEEWMQDMVKNPGSSQTIGKLSKIATIEQAWDAQQALHLLKQDKVPRAILITDPGITDLENRELSRRVIEYARNGGTVVLSMYFASTVEIDDFEAYMEQWGLPWRVHSGTRRDCAVNPSASGRPNLQWMEGLPALYWSKSLFLHHVAPEDCWYLPAPSQDDDDPETQTPIVFSKIGKGFLGFIGDVNQTAAADAVLLAMLGMNDKVRWCSC